MAEADITIRWPSGRSETYRVPSALVTSTDAAMTGPGWAHEPCSATVVIHGRRVLESGGRAIRVTAESVRVVVSLAAVESLTIAPA